MQNIYDYVNLQNEIDLLHLNIEALTEKENIMKTTKNEYLKMEQTLKELQEKIEAKLKELKGIKKELLYEIVVNGLNVTKAVDKVAFSNDIDVSTIWKSYYPDVKVFLNELKKSSENQVI